MRLLLVLPLVIGCVESPSPTNEDDRPPDAGCYDIGAFEIAAPRHGLMYSQSMDVYVHETELWASLTLDMVDDTGRTYVWTTDGTMPYSGEGHWWNVDNFHYELAPSHRYTLTVSHCSAAQTVTFFTVPQ